jgi:hypothetical protein
MCDESNRVTVKPPKPFNAQEIRRQMALHPERLIPMEWLGMGFTWAEWEALPESPYESGDMITGHVMPPDQAVTHALKGAGPADAAAVSKKHHGRNPGELVDAGKLKRFRGNLSQSEFAEKCQDVSPATIQRGEAGGRWDSKTFVRVAETLTC